MVNRIMKEMYKDTPDGLEGNEDCGQMSAWYVLSALGFYPVTPGTTDYIIGTPLFSSATIHLENGKSFAVKGNNISADNFYIQSATLNKKMHTRSSISYFDINKGGVLNFNMGAKPSSFGTTDFPATAIADNKIVLNPVIDGGSISFKENKTIRISSAQKDVIYYYTMDGLSPTASSKKYEGPITINATTTIKAIAVSANGEKSFITTALYKKSPNNWTIKLNTQYEKQYDGGGSEGLIDDIHGSANWQKGNWQGYQKTDLDVVIDLQEMKTISKVGIGFLQDTRAWIVLPKQIIIEVSENNKNFVQVYVGGNFIPIDDLKAQVKNIEATFATVSARYIRVKAIQYGKLPFWHEGAGGDTHIFADEIEIR
jgi:hypothetical protein